MIIRDVTVRRTVGLPNYSSATVEMSASVEEEDVIEEVVAELEGLVIAALPQEQPSVKQNTGGSYTPRHMDDDSPACPDCGGPMRLRRSEYGEFYGCKSYPDCRGKVAA